MTEDRGIPVQVRIVPPKMKEPKYVIICEEKRKIFFADEKEIYAYRKVKKKNWNEVEKKFKLGAYGLKV